jgi:predicted nucleic acid-binding protein
VADYLLDTMILRYWYDSGCQENASVVSYVHAARRPDPQTQYISRLFVSTVTIGEIEFGHRVIPALNPAEQAKYMSFVRQEFPEPLPVTRHVGEYYGILKAWLFNNCSPKSMRTKAKRYRELVDPTSGEALEVQENDVWIAAQAMTHRLVLVTHDSRGNFGKLLKQFAGDLDVQDWAKL